MTAKISSRFLFLLSCLLIISPAFAENNFVLPQSNTPPRTYLPGDLVHIVVGSPANVVKVVAEMPNGERVTLDFERRTHIWHGLWEVPYNFKKGIYSANLIATDVEGKTFEGKTSSFYVGEPTLVTLIGLETTKESASQPAVRLPIQPVETMQKPPAAEEIVEPEAPADEEEAKTKVSSPKRKIKARKTPAVSARLKSKDLLKLKLKLFTMVRVHLTTQQYEKARADLRELLKLDPKNQEIKKMRDRVEKVLKTKGAGND